MRSNRQDYGSNRSGVVLAGGIGMVICLATGAGSSGPVESRLYDSWLLGFWKTSQQLQTGESRLQK